MTTMTTEQLNEIETAAQEAAGDAYDAALEAGQDETAAERAADTAWNAAYDAGQRAVEAQDAEDAARAAEIEADEREGAVYVYGEYCMGMAGRRFAEEKADEQGKRRSAQHDATRYTREDLPFVVARAKNGYNSSAVYAAKVLRTLRAAWDIADEAETEQAE